MLRFQMLAQYNCAHDDGTDWDRWRWTRWEEPLPAASRWLPEVLTGPPPERQAGDRLIRCCGLICPTLRRRLRGLRGASALRQMMGEIMLLVLSLALQAVAEEPLRLQLEERLELSHRRVSSLLPELCRASTAE